MPFNIDQKKWDNFWYYYKIHVYVGIFILVFIIMTVRDCMQNVEPDVSFFYMGINLQPTHIEHIEQDWREVIQDVNNDGKKYVLIASAFDIQKLQLLIMTREAQLLLLDKENFTNYASHGAFYPLDEFIARHNLTFEDYPEIRITPEEAQKESIYGIPIEKNRFFTDLGLITKERYLVLIPPGIKPNPKEIAIYENAYAILERILIYAQ